MNTNAADDFSDRNKAMAYLKSLPVALKDIPAGIEYKTIGYPFYERLAEAFFQTIRLNIFIEEMESYDRCLKRDGYSVMDRWEYEVMIWKRIEKLDDTHWFDAQKIAIASIPKIIKARKVLGN